MNRRVAGVLALVLVLVACASVGPKLITVSFGQWRTGLGARLLTVWGLTALYALASLAFGHAVVQRLSTVRRDGAWPLAFSTGTITFAVSLGLFGWFGWLHTQLFWGLPIAMLALGLPAFRDAVIDAHERWQRAPNFSWVELVAFAFGAVGLFLLLFQVLTPENVNFDAAWYHLRSAERYALAGAIERTPEGDTLLALPSATSWLYTWAFLAPGLSLEDQVTLALHLEFAVFVGTLACVPALVRALIPELKATAARTSWVALFFFPSVFIYDTGLMGGADHVVALWAATTVLAWAHARERDDLASWLLLGFQLAGLSAKYSSLYLVVPLAPMMLVDAWVRGRSRAHSSLRSVRGLLVSAAVALVMTAPYWVKNWVYYRNPIYPALASLFPNSPWNVDAAAWQAYYQLSNVFTAATGSPAWRVSATLTSLTEYHVNTYGWADMMGGASVMGVGYFMSQLVWPVLPVRRRLFALALLINGGIMVWFNVHQHHMRYLTVLTPLMAAGLAATALSLWSLGWPGRLSVLIATGLMLVAYGDVPFRHTHRMWRRSSPVDNTDDYLSRQGVSVRYNTWKLVGAELPPQAKPLVHGIVPHLGLPRASVTDCVGLQFGINYGRWGSVGEAYRQLRAMGVTHLLWTGDFEQPDSVSGEAIFGGLAAATVNQRVVEGIHLGELPAEAPTEPGTKLVYVDCTHQWPSGLYSLPVLVEPLPPVGAPWPSVVPERALTRENWASALTDPEVAFVALEESCVLPAPAGFIPMGIARPTNVRFFVRQR